MSSAMNSRKRTIWFLACLLLIFAAVAMLVTWPFLRAIASAVILAVIFHPVYQWVLRRISGRRGLASLIVTLAIIAIFLGPVTFILLKAASEAVAAAQRLSRLSAEQGGFAAFVAAMLDRPLHF